MGRTIKVNNAGDKPAARTEGGGGGSGSTVFCGNLPFSVDENKVRSHFESCGDIKGVRIAYD
jgi:RNA recognition motif-containing protein